jgi:aminoglycoside 6'-N-acetyltransferase I
LWPETTSQEHRSEVEALMGQPQRAIAFLARTAEGSAIGFAEAMLRHDYVNGCATSPVAFLEGIYVHPDHRRLGAARLLCEAVQDWGAGLGCSELASDADLGNLGSQRMHMALGFEETERVVYFRKALPSRR